MSATACSGDGGRRPPGLMPELLPTQLPLWRALPRWLHRWRVTSRRAGDAGYVVAEATDHAFACSCPRWIYHRERCWHIRQVLTALGRDA